MAIETPLYDDDTGECLFDGKIGIGRAFIEQCGLTVLCCIIFMFIEKLGILLRAGRRIYAPFVGRALILTRLCGPNFGMGYCLF